MRLNNEQITALVPWAHTKNRQMKYYYNQNKCDSIGAPSTDNEILAL